MATPTGHRYTRVYTCTGTYMKDRFGTHVHIHALELQYRYGILAKIKSPHGTMADRSQRHVVACAACHMACDRMTHEYQYRAHAIASFSKHGTVSPGHAESRHDYIHSSQFKGRGTQGSCVTQEAGGKGY